MSDLLTLIEHLEQVEQCMHDLVKQNRKLKLERLMWKAGLKAAAWAERVEEEECHCYDRAERWLSLRENCRKKL